MRTAAIALLLVASPVLGAYRKPMPYGFQKPPVGAQVDWGNPINIGLAHFYLMNEGGGRVVRDIAQPGLYDLTIADTNTNWQPSNMGVGLKRTFAQHGSLLPTRQFTMATSFSWDAWIFDDNSAGTFRNLFCNLTGTVGVWTRDSGVLLFFTIGGTEEAGTVDLRNKWSHVALTYGGTTLTFYVNGVLDKTFTLSGGSFTVNGFLVDPAANGIESFGGWCNYQRFWSRTLTAAEVSSLHTAPFQGMTAPKQFFAIPPPPPTSFIIQDGSIVIRNGLMVISD